MERRTVTAGIATLFQKPEWDAERADEALLGMTVETLGPEVNGFLPVRTHYRYEGYIPAICISALGVNTESWEKAAKWTVWAPYLDVQAKPYVQAAAITSCPRGSRLEMLPKEEEPPRTKDDDKEGWTYIGLPDGRAGYVRSACIAPYIAESDKPLNGTAQAREETIRRNLVNTAKRYMGTQYRWGGKTPHGIDCSGLTSISYMLNGILIYRDADIRPGFAMKDIDMAHIKPGDLLFFKGHVAMYTGDGAFIHSTGYHKSVGVVTNSLRPDAAGYREDLANGILKVGSVF
jgi:hypothetical protein